MPTTDEPPRPKGRPGPKLRGRAVETLTITITHAQRDALDALAEAEKSTLSGIVRRFIDEGLAKRTDTV